MKGSAEKHEKDDRYDWCGHHGGFVLAVRRIQPMLELFETVRWAENIFFQNIFNG